MRTHVTDTQQPFIEKTFKLTDTVFIPGAIFRSYSIFYYMDTDTLRPESLPQLDSLADFLKKNEKLGIEIRNHCDERWSSEYSTEPSRYRASAVRDYLISKGINPDRLIAKGYNKADPIIVGAKTEEEHRINRRTEFVIDDIRR
jgi:outer membrane protein OmpA-like peptidoglycan-associated protein